MVKLPTKKKKPISITHDGKQLLMVYANASEVRKFFRSIDRSKTRADGGDGRADGIPDLSGVRVANSYEDGLGKRFYNLDLVLAAKDLGDILDATFCAEDEASTVSGSTFSDGGAFSSFFISEEKDTAVIGTTPEDTTDSKAPNMDLFQDPNTEPSDEDIEIQTAADIQSSCRWCGACSIREKS